MRILVVEGDDRLREALTVGFGLGWPDVVVIPADCANSALHSFRDECPDIVVLDAVLPDKDGFELLRDIRRVSNVPAIMLVEPGVRSNASPAPDPEGYDPVAKPVRYAELLSRVERRLAA